MPEPKLTKDEPRQQLTAALVGFHGKIIHCAPGAVAQDDAERRDRRARWQDRQHRQTAGTAAALTNERSLQTASSIDTGQCHSPRSS